MSFLVHALITIAIIYCVVVWVIAGRILFTDNNVKPIRYVLVVAFWLLSPILALDIFVRSFLERVRP